MAEVVSHCAFIAKNVGIRNLNWTSCWYYYETSSANDYDRNEIPMYTVGDAMLTTYTEKVLEHFSLQERKEWSNFQSYPVIGIHRSQALKITQEWKTRSGEILRSDKKSTWEIFLKTLIVSSHPENLFLYNPC